MPNLQQHKKKNNNKKKIKITHTNYSKLIQNKENYIQIKDYTSKASLPITHYPPPPKQNPQMTNKNPAKLDPNTDDL